LIGNNIGKNDVVEAKVQFKYLLVISLIFLTVETLVVIYFGIDFLSLITENSMVIEITKPVIFIFALAVFPEGIRGMIKGVVKGLGL
jgi:Na+-driven multidrug efflux pump